MSQDKQRVELETPRRRCQAQHRLSWRKHLQGALSLPCPVCLGDPRQLASLLITPNSLDGLSQGLGDCAWTKQDAQDPFSSRIPQEWGSGHVERLSAPTEEAPTLEAPGCSCLLE